MGLDVVGAVVADLFFPLLGVALACAVAWRLLPPGLARTRLQIAGTLLFFAPLVAAGVLWKQSIRLVLHQEGLAALWCLAIAAALARRIVLQRQGRWPTTSKARARLLRSPIGLGVVAVGFGTAGLWLSGRFSLDAFGRRERVDGPVERMWVSAGPRHVAVDRYFVVGGRRYEATADVFQRLRIGAVIHGEAGAGSGKLLHIGP